MPSLKLAFMGTPDFSIPILDALVAAGHTIAVVYTQQPRRAGRGQALQKTPVHERAEQLNIPVRTPGTLKDKDEQARFAALGLDAAVVAAYGLILPPEILSAPRLGCLNVHASLLPRWRGAAPIQRAIMAGDSATGITIMQMDEGLDTGGILLSQSIPIHDVDTAGSLHDRLAGVGAPLMVQALNALAAGTIAATPQPHTGVSTAAKITKAEARLDWTRPATELECRIRGLSPFPGAWFGVSMGGRSHRIKVLRAELAGASGTPGTVLSEDLTVACGEGALRLLTLQRAGGRPMGAQDFLRGFALPLGTQFDLRS